MQQKKHFHRGRILLLWKLLPFWRLRGGGPVGSRGDCWCTVCTSSYRSTSALTRLTAETVKDRKAVLVFLGIVATWVTQRHSGKWKFIFPTRTESSAAWHLSRRWLFMSSEARPTGLAVCLASEGANKRRGAITTLITGITLFSLAPWTAVTPRHPARRLHSRWLDKTMVESCRVPATPTWHGVYFRLPPSASPTPSVVSTCCWPTFHHQRPRWRQQTLARTSQWNASQKCCIFYDNRLEFNDFWNLEAHCQNKQRRVAVKWKLLNLIIKQSGRELCKIFTNHLVWLGLQLVLLAAYLLWLVALKPFKQHSDCLWWLAIRAFFFSNATKLLIKFHEWQINTQQVSTRMIQWVNQHL